LTADDLKRRVAKEAATLLYFGAEKEYKQAKGKAAQTLGTHFLPSNLEVALELDKIAEENEGEKRKDRLVEMRSEALRVMRLLGAFCPVLMARLARYNSRGSDIDIAVYADDADKVLVFCNKGGRIRVQKTNWTTVNKKGATMNPSTSTQKLPPSMLKIVVRSAEEATKKRRCKFLATNSRPSIKDLKKSFLHKPHSPFIPQYPAS
jgi:predicted nucleotidyltransferase